jgi:hypothetical protein
MPNYGSVPAAAVDFSFAPQPALVGEDGTFDVTEYNWRKLVLLALEGGLNVMEEPLSNELGTIIVPPGVIRTGVGFEMQLSAYARLEESLGWLLYATLGDVETTANEDINGNAAPGVYTHRFRFDPDSSYLIPYFASRFKLPSFTGTDDRGEVGFDCMVASLSLQVPQRGKIGVQLGLRGREAIYDNNPGAWEVVNNYEFTETAPESSTGHFKIGGVEYPIFGIEWTMNNALTGMDEEQVVGSLYAGSFVPLSRSAQGRAVVKFADNKLSQEVYTGVSDGTTVNTLPAFVETTGGVKAFEGYFEAPSKIPGTNTPYALAIQGDRVVMTRQGGTSSQAGRIMVNNYSFLLVHPGDGRQYFEIVLQNGIPSYEWPTGSNPQLPVLNLGVTAVDYEGVPFWLMPAAQFYDQDGAEFAGATLTVSASAGTPTLVGGDLLDVTTPADVLYNGTDIGALTTNANGFVFTFNAAASVSALEEVMQSVYYDETLAGPSTDTITVSFTDGDAASATPKTVVVNHLDV